MSNGTCYHCGGPNPARGAFEESHGGETLRFCCRGCLGAFRLIRGAGLEDFYRRRTTAEAGLAEGAYGRGWSDDTLASFVRPAPDGSETIDFLVEGIRCASCVWLVEKVLARVDGIAEARVNYATGRTSVRFRRQETTPAAIFRRVAELGYVPSPWSDTAAGSAAEAERRDLLFRFGTAVFLSMQLMGFAVALYSGWLHGIDPVTRKLLGFASLAVTTPVVFWCGLPFLRGSVRGIRNGAPGMDLLIAAGALSSYGYSLFALFSGGEVYFETAAMIVTIILGGRLLEHGARRKAAGGVERLLRLLPSRARRLTAAGTEEIPADEAAPGDLLLVLPEESFPVDGTVAAGSSEIDVSAVTGEPLPEAIGPGSAVSAGSVNLMAEITLRVVRPARDSFLRRVAALVQEAQGRRAPIQSLADRVAALFVPLVLLLAIMTGIAHHLGGSGTAASVLAAVAVVVIACPCSLGLATPAAMMAGTAAAAAQGVLFRGGDVVERLAGIDVVVFDKTGTLTVGRPEICRTHGDVIGRLLQVAAPLEHDSPHPFAKGIRAAAAAAGMASGGAENVRFFPGEGVTGCLDGKEAAAGNDRLMARLELPLPEIPLAAGESPVHVALGGKWLGTLVFRDMLRPSAKGTVGSLKKAGLRTILLSGDRAANAAAVAAEAGIGESHGGFLPEEKAAFVARLKAEGARVLMVGDGINDAPALAAASVGCAPAGGTDAALESADLIITHPDLDRLVFAREASAQTMRVVRQNLVWAFLYNLAGIPLAMTGTLAPLHAAAAMALSSVCVSANSLRLLRLRRG